MSNVIGNAIGAVIGIKILETGMKVIKDERKKVKLDGNLLGNSKKEKEWY